MRRILKSRFLIPAYWKGWRRGVALTTCVVSIFVLGFFRVATEAEYSFASLAILPVMFVAWVGGIRVGIAIAITAAAMWIVGDFLGERDFAMPWVLWINGITRLLTYILVAALVAQVQILFEREHERATQDGLTGLLNRRAFVEAGKAEVERSRRYSHSLAIIFLDLDNFKQLNDTLGHDAGDAALQSTANALLESLRTSDRVSRLGGDEFAALLPEIDYPHAVETGRKISSAVHNALQAFPPVKVSAGVAWFDKSDRSFGDMLKAADQLMYEVKEKGKGHISSRQFPAT